MELEEEVDTFITFLVIQKTTKNCVIGVFRLKTDKIQTMLQFFWRYPERGNPGERKPNVQLATLKHTNILF